MGRVDKISLCWGAVIASLLLVVSPSLCPAGLLAPGTPIAGDFVIGPTSPGNWGGPGAVVTYSFATGLGYSTSEAGSGGTIVPLESFMPFSKAAIEAEFLSAFDAWEAAAGITFVEVADNGAAFDAFGATGDIRLGGHVFDGAFGTLAHGFFPPVNGTSAAGDIHFDTAETWKIGFGGGGFDIFTVAAHEIGHAIGLSHTGVASSLMNAFYSEAVVGPQADDIAGAQFLFGLPTVANIPEPGTLVLTLLGLVSLAIRPRRAA